MDPAEGAAFPVFLDLREFQAKTGKMASQVPQEHQARQADSHRTVSRSRLHRASRATKAQPVHQAIQDRQVTSDLPALRAEMASPDLTERREHREQPDLQAETAMTALLVTLVNQALARQ